MNKGDILEIEIVSTGMNGEGVARVDNKVLFVSRTLVGEKARVQITECKKNFCNAKVIKLLSSSKERVEPVCPIYFRCGGCELQHINYESQLAIKRKNVSNCLRKELGEDIQVLPTIPSPKTLAYRNKIQLPIAVENGKIVVGYFKQSSHKVVPLVKTDSLEYGDCPLCSRDMQAVVDIFVDWANKYNLSVYDESKHKGLLRHFCVRKVGDSYAIVVVINGKVLPHQDKLIQAFCGYGLSFSLYLSINTDRTNVIYGKQMLTLYGADTLQDNILGVVAEVSPLSFMQINNDIRDMIYSRVQDIIKQNAHSVVFDLFSGVGVLSNIFAKYSDKVVGIEIVEDAVRNADRLAQLNGNAGKITNICGDVTQELGKAMAKLQGENLQDSIVVIDPPRKGCTQVTLDSIVSARPNKIVYISCNPATLARDLKTLTADYSLDWVQPYDMFPMTSHVETVVLLSKVCK